MKMKVIQKTKKKPVNYYLVPFPFSWFQLSCFTVPKSKGFSGLYGPILCFWKPFTAYHSKVYVDGTMVLLLCSHCGCTCTEVIALILLCTSSPHSQTKSFTSVCGCSCGSEQTCHLLSSQSTLVGGGNQTGHHQNCQFLCNSMWLELTIQKIINLIKKRWEKYVESKSVGVQNWS